MCYNKDTALTLIEIPSWSSFQNKTLTLLQDIVNITENLWETKKWVVKVKKNSQIAHRHHYLSFDHATIKTFFHQLLFSHSPPDPSLITFYHFFSHWPLWSLSQVSSWISSRKFKFSWFYFAEQFSSPQLLPPNLGLYLHFLIHYQPSKTKSIFI